MPTFTKLCPQCGKFEGVKVVSTKLIDSEDAPVGDAKDTWEISLQCSKCGHVWTKTAVSSA